ncbi:hypothetical protein EDB80DRAFT_868857 [Ilyonectria destructans]|nr:hypothetical protein EDB80DRAFT_868857 [Ilyonectria destructans]
MSGAGHCNCGSISIELKEEQRSSSLVCYWYAEHTSLVESKSLIINSRGCSRAGGGYSVNYVVDDSDIDIQDARSTLKTYIDTNTDSGNKVQRLFCGDCGSPVLTRSPKFPGKGILKASLFDTMAAPSAEVYTSRREVWQPAIDGAVSR